MVTLIEFPDLLLVLFVRFPAITLTGFPGFLWIVVASAGFL
jgi:hypothetical protein